MKMSKSIKDYKDAMDSVKISDSFYKRTEVLLNESSQMEIVKSSPSKIKVITRSAMALAACLLLGFGVKTVIDSRAETDTAVVTEIVQETTVVTVPVTVPETASPVIDRIEEGGGFVNDSGVLVGEMPAIPEEEIDDAAEETVAVNPTVAGTENKLTSDTDDIPTVEEEEIEEAAPIAPVETTATTAAKEGYPEMAEPQGAENIPPLSDMAKENVSVKITPYFDLGEIKSGENPVTKSGSEFGQLISTISAVINVSPTGENESFKSLFLIQLSDSTSGITYYSIYVTDASTMVVTRHDIDNQKRFTYGLSEADYDAILRQLYSNFGNESEYDFFRSFETSE
ncbi:MAG: hypothetical protein J6A05_03380 [Oscillospiraceae bacterium]|nr:hypothetical protein [Oscillospiraceae bacterium]